ncbi:C-terminal binding protein [Streptomyces sp. NPDC093085]|uniref:C-terminal binding protein n=1 Tax=Streptomyces sp. NPDC093085 TaxID=3155068 RepID=UPI0034344AF6
MSTTTSTATTSTAATPTAAIPTVVVTDYEFADLAPERAVIEGAGFRLVPAQARTPEELVAACAGADAVINQYAQLTAEVIGALPKVRVISRYGIGLNTIDVDAATAAGIIVANVPDGSLEDVSDHTSALILALARGLGPYRASLAADGWDYTVAAPLFRLRGRTLGLLGFGRIPQYVARKLAGFGLRVLASDPYADPAVAAGLGVELVDTETLLRAADFVSVHTPLTPETTGLLGAEAFALMKPTAYLVNTARGPVIDQDALVAALESGRIAGAGLDVFATEPLPAGHPLRTLPNVLLSPHCAWYSEDSEAEIRTKAARNVVEVLTGAPLTYHVNKDVVPRRAPSA